MTRRWDAVNARARGLSTHLLSAGQFASLARSSDLSALAAALRSLGLLQATVTETPGAEAMELAIRRWAAGLLRVLARWTGHRADALPLVFDDEDRRSVRAIVRGAVAGLPSAARLAGLIPTPALPERALEAMAGAATVAQTGAMLAAWRHPFAAAVPASDITSRTDLLTFELALARLLAGRLREAARRAHDRALRLMVEDMIDLENAVTAISIAGHDDDLDVGAHFLDGGVRLQATSFLEAARSGASSAAAAILGRALARSRWAPALERHGDDPGMLEEALVRQRLRWLARQVRQEPLGALATVQFSLRLRVQVIDLQRIIWTVALGGSRRWLGELLTPVPA